MHIFNRISKLVLVALTVVLALGFMAIAAVFLIGTALGARFQAAPEAALQALVFIFLPILASSGIGLILGTLIRSEQGALYTGIGLAITTGFISGIFTLYSQLIPVLQLFARVYPISAANSSLIYILVGEAMAGYNPLEAGQVALTVSTSVILFAAGLALYAKYCWRKE